MSKCRLISGLLAIAFLLGGCNRPFREAPNPLEIDAREYDRIYQASIDVLREYGFRVNRQDHRFGRITSYPLDSPTVFEPWRAYNTTGAQAWQSTFTTLQRTVTVFIEPTADDTEDAATPTANPPPYDLRVEVLLENLQLPTRRMIPAQGGRMFSSLSETPRPWPERGIESSYWLPIGRDPYLEDRLIRDIVERSLQITNP